MKKYGPFLALAALLLLCIATGEAFRNPANYPVIGRQACYTGIIALGMTLVIAAGGIDLAVGSLFALSGVVGLLIAQQLPGGDLLQLFGLLAITVACGAAGGALNGALIGKWRLPPFIVTLGTMSIFRSLGLYLADAGRVTGSNIYFADIGAFWAIGSWVVLALLGYFLLEWTPFGRHVCAVGSNEQVARYAAIPAGRVRFFTYLITGALCGVSAFLWVARLGGMSSASDGSGYELDAIAAVIVGGSSMSGGKVCWWGTLAGVLILTLIGNALVSWGISPKLQELVKGLVIIVAVWMQYRKRSEA